MLKYIISEQSCCSLLLCEQNVVVTPLGFKPKTFRTGI